MSVKDIENFKGVGPPIFNDTQLHVNLQKMK